VTLRLAPDTHVRRHLARVAQGAEPADVIVTGGTLVDVFTEELHEGWGIAIASGRVAAVGPDVAARAGDVTQVIDAEGDLIVPGLVETHTHQTRLRLPDTARLQVKAGVTSTLLETPEIGMLMGPRAVRELLEWARSVPGRVFFTVPPLIGTDPDHEEQLGAAEDWIPLLDEPGIAGVGEIYWADWLRGHTRADALVDAALDRGLTVEGHGAGARPHVLQALAGNGFASDHEAISAEETLTRLRAGMHALVRHGATRQDLPALAPLWQDHDIDLGRASFCTDGLEPEAMVAGESLNWVVDQAVALGLPLARAVRMASRNPAERLGAGRWIGGLAPGMFGDLAVVPPSSGFRPRLVLVGGQPPAEPAPFDPPTWMLDSVRLPELTDALLSHPGPGRWRAMELVAPIVTREVETHGDGDLVAVAIDRLRPGRAFRGLLRGYGLRGGAVAVTTSWESASLLVVGDSTADLRTAVAAVAEMGGGAAVASSGQLLARWAAPVAGIYSTAPAEDVVTEVRQVQGALRSLGVPYANPLMSVETLTTAAIPFLRIGAAGYRRLRDGAMVGLEWESS
jgi:adenine deaminase